MPHDHQETTHVVFILDSSGSMGAIRDEAIEMFNQQVSEARNTSRGRTTVSFTTFGTGSRPIIHTIGADLGLLEPLTHETYKPDGMTPLYDAIGWTIERVERELNTEDENTSVLVVIISDGQENHSGQWQKDVPHEQRHRAYSAADIAEMIARLDQTGRWTLTYLGANQDLREVQKNLGFKASNMQSFAADIAGMNRASADLRSSSKRYYEARANGIKSQDDFFATEKPSASPRAQAGRQPANSISVIMPYLWNGVWVFDDPARGLDKEALVSSVPEMIERVCAQKGIPNPSAGFVVIFSARPFPDADVVLDHVRPDEHGEGNWYRLSGTQMEGWLCPALLKYFPSAPRRIYLQVKEKAND